MLYRVDMDVIHMPGQVGIIAVYDHPVQVVTGPDQLSKNDCHCQVGTPGPV